MSAKIISHKAKPKAQGKQDEQSSNVHVNQETGSVTVSCPQKSQRVNLSLCDHYECQDRETCDSYRDGINAKADFWAQQNGLAVMLDHETDETVEVECKVELTPDEAKVLSEQMANDIVQKISLEKDKKESADQYNQKIKKLEAVIYQSAAILQNGFVYRHVPCTTEKDFEKKIVRLTRTDTKEVVKERPMTGSDFELDLPM
jgi:hypothetical protein